MTSPSIQHCLAAVVSDTTRVLVVGSLPGAASLASQSYYANPRNHFWRLIGTAIEVDLVSLPYSERLGAMLAAGIGLWDTVAAAVRPGSLDSAIRLHAATDLSALAATLPRLRGIGFNGATAAHIGRRSLGDTSGLTLVDLPSSSPAYTLSLAAKQERWCVLRALL